MRRSRWTTSSRSRSLAAELVDESSSANGSKVKGCRPGLEANGGVGGVCGELNANFPNGTGEGE